MKWKRYRISTELDFRIDFDKKPTKKEMKKYQDAIRLWVENREPLPDGVVVRMTSTFLLDDKKGTSNFLKRNKTNFYFETLTPLSIFKEVGQ